LKNLYIINEKIDSFYSTLTILGGGFFVESKKAIEELLLTVENANLDELFNSFINEEDADKKMVLKSLFTYALDKNQKEQSLKIK